MSQRRESKREKQKRVRRTAIAHLKHPAFEGPVFEDAEVAKVVSKPAKKAKKTKKKKKA